jgi:hypothetical protein
MQRKARPAIAGPGAFLLLSLIKASLGCRKDYASFGRVILFVDSRFEIPDHGLIAGMIRIIKLAVVF